MAGGHVFGGGRPLAPDMEVLETVAEVAAELVLEVGGVVRVPVPKAELGGRGGVGNRFARRAGVFLARDFVLDLPDIGEG